MLWLRTNNSTKKYGEGMMLRCNQTNSRALDKMVPLKWSENRETLFSGPFWCAGNGVPMQTLTNKEIYLDSNLDE